MKREENPVFKNLKNREVNEIFGSLPTPCYIIDEVALLDNAKILNQVAKDTGCKILLAQKAFSNYDFYKLLSPYLAGTEASGLYEARLGRERMPEREVHVFCGAYKEEEFEEVLKYADHVVFNSPYQLKKFGPRAKACGKSVGLRINPECSTQQGHAIYDPCAEGSRLGTTRDVWDKEMTGRLISLLDGLHFHTLCEQDADDLETTLKAVEDKFGDVLPKLNWLNMGGGHHITKSTYDVEKLKNILKITREKWNLQVYLEPGEAVALNCGYLISSVLDIVKNGNVTNVIIDASAACHMPDVIEMPYTPPLYMDDSKGKYSYRFAGPTCLAGDVIGDYNLSRKLKFGDKVVFGDMAIYSTCKNNTFNGMPLPNIYRWENLERFEKLTDFDYFDFKYRLGSKKG